MEDEQWRQYLTSIGIPHDDDKYAKPVGVRQTVVIQNAATKQWDRYGRVRQVLPQRRYLISVYGGDTDEIITRHRSDIKLADPDMRKKFQAPPTANIAARSEMDPDAAAAVACKEMFQVPPSATGCVLPGVAAEDAVAAKLVKKEDAKQPTSRSRGKKPKVSLLLRQLRPYNSPGLQEK